MKKSSCQLLLAFMFICLANAGLHAQLLGYPTSGANIVHNSGVFYTDNVRARVTNISSGLVSITNKTANFSGGDRVLIIQMIGGTVGTHEGAIVSSVTGGGNTLILTAPPSHSYSMGGMVQVIKVFDYNNFTLNDGIVTCHPWDQSAGHGGVLCFRAVNLTINDGYITASGRGYYPIGWTWGLGGAGGSGSTNAGAGGSGSNGSQAGAGGGYAACSPTGLCGDDVGLLIPGYNGGVGEHCSGCTGTNGTASSGTVTSYGLPSLNTRIKMGSAGYPQSGYGGGQGAEGGGAGGGGGASGSGNPGSNGQNGSAGGAGGNGGRGAAGGGIVYIKTTSLTIAGGIGHEVFLADGQAGDAGRFGGHGGKGGIGGSGGQGVCNLIDKYQSGGNGGSGLPGIGATGGDGSFGGYAGTIWVITKNTNPLTSANVSVKGGVNGNGGRGGYAAKTAVCGPTTLIDLADCDADIEECTPTPNPAVTHICDCEKAFRILATATSTNDNSVEYEYKVGSTIVAKYDYTNRRKLIAYETVSGVDYAYHCNLTTNEHCDKIFNQIRTGNVDAGASLITLNGSFSNVWTNGSSSPFNLRYQNGGTVYMEYRSDWKYITDYFDAEGPKKCYESSCNPGNPIGDADDNDPFKGNPGRDPEGSTPNGTADRNNPEANCPLPGGSNNVTGWKTSATDIEDMFMDQVGIKVQPNPVVNELTVNFILTEPLAVKLSVMDVTGKKVYSEPYLGGKGENQVIIPVNTLPAGTYILQVIAGDKVSVMKVVKQ